MLAYSSFLHLITYMYYILAIFLHTRSRVANHVTSDGRVHGIYENKLLNSGNIFLDMFVNTCQI